MNAKDKAEELYNDYLSTVRFTMEDCSWSYRGDTWEFCVRRTAKWSALIAVDEILKNIITKKLLVEIGEWIETSENNYWQEVKNEIEKL